MMFYQSMKNFLFSHIFIYQHIGHNWTLFDMYRYVQSLSFKRCFHLMYRFARKRCKNIINLMLLFPKESYIHSNILSTIIHLYKKLDFHLTFMSLLDKGCKSMVVILYRSLSVHLGIPQSVTKRKIRNRFYTQWKSGAYEWYSNKLIHFAFYW